MSALPPGPGSLPVHLLYRWLKNPYPLMDELRREYGETFTLRIGGLAQRAHLPPQRRIWCRSAVDWSIDIGALLASAQQ